jgi:NodT family efflux transporter outer membrane factor (OMF) lipoprotein
MSKRLNLWMVCGAMSWLAGCATGPDFARPDAPKTDSYGGPGAEGRTAAARGPGGAAQRFSAETGLPAQWWELFHSEELSRRVGDALENSPTLAQALARLRQAREEYNAQAGSTRYPAVDAGLGAKRQKVNPEAMGMQNVPTPDPFAVYNASLSVSYAFDLFGKNRRMLEGLKAQVDRREVELEAARQTLAANVVLASIRQAELEKQTAVANEIVSARKAQMEIARKRLETGGISAREMEGLGVVLEQARAVLPALESQAAQIRRQLAVYLGREPAEASKELLDLDALRLPEELPVSLPSDVARQRPDIRAAEAVWHRACANAGVAAANLFPQFTLAASLGSQTTDAADLLDSMNVWSIGGELMQPIFRGGALRAQKRAAEAACDEAAAAYRDTVLRGLQEVADALEALESDARALEARAAAVHHAKTALDVALRQVEEGGLSRAAALDEKVRHLQAEADRVRAQAARHADTAALFHALGGGWWNQEKSETSK